MRDRRERPCRRAQLRPPARRRAAVCRRRRRGLGGRGVAGAAVATGRVAFDVRRGRYAGHTGIGRYVAELVRELERRDDVVVRPLASSEGGFTSRVRKLAWEQARLLPAAASGEVFHAPYYEVSPLAGR